VSGFRATMGLLWEGLVILVVVPILVAVLVARVVEVVTGVAKQR